MVEDYEVKWYDEVTQRLQVAESNQEPQVDKTIADAVTKA